MNAAARIGHASAPGADPERCLGSPETQSLPEGPDKAVFDGRETGPHRRCIATRRVRPKADLIRFVISPDGTLTLDLAEKLPGRGYWVAAERSTLERAVSKGYFSRAAKAQVRVPDGLIDSLATALSARCRNTVELARRAGQAVSGFEKVRAWALAGRATVLITASDGAENGRKKLEGLAAGRVLVDCLESSALSTAFGRTNVVHAALAGGNLAERLVVDAARLSGLIRPPEGRPTRGNDRSAPDRRVDNGRE